MDQPEYVVRVKAWPAYVLAVLVPVQTIVCVGVLGFLVWRAPLSDPLFVAVFILLALAVAVMLGSMGVALVRAMRVVRYPPRLSAEGIRLWLFPAATYVLIPWPRVAAVRAVVKGVSLGLFVHVHDPEALADGKPATARKIQRMMRRFHGTPFVYPLKSTPARLYECDQALQWFSRGRLALQR